MAQKAPGKAHRKGLTLLEVAGTFRDEDAARKWIEQEYWPDGPFCPKCGSFNVQANIKHRTATHRCRDCTSGTTKTFFTLRTGTVMERTRLPYRHWAIAMYLFTTNLEGVSSMKLHRELGSIQKSAWFMLHRLRKAAEVTHPERFSGPAEGDEVAIGGKRRNMSNAKRRELAAPGVGRGSVGKTIVSGVKDRPTKHVRAKVVEATDKPTLEGFAVENTEPDATVYTVEASANEGLPRHHESVKHSASEYVRGQDTNGIESFWSMLRRGYIGIYHKMSPKHLNRYVAEFQGRHNDRESDTIDQMGNLVRGMVGKRLTYEALIASNGLDSEARKG